MIIDSRYKVLEQLGTGIWATVYKVVDSRTGSLCTLKLFQHLDAHTLYEKFSAEEMHHITRLEHPNLVPVITFGNMGKHIYSVSQYYKGKSLQNFKFKINRLNLFYDLIIQCLYALNALHSQKIYHKDIKPSNILYSLTDNQIDVKLIDYGFNKIDTDKNQQTVSGTLPYMAPELFLNKTASAQSDFYSLGVTLYKITTGTLPFSLEQITAIISGNQQNFFPKFIREINPEIPLPLEKFIMKLLEKNPRDRFLDARSAIAFINKIQSLNYSFSQRISLVQSVKFNSYIVRANYAHQLVDQVENMLSNNGKLITLIGGDGIGKDDLLTLFKYHFFTNEFYIFDYTCSAKSKDPFFALIREFSTSTLNNERKQTIFDNISIRFKKFLEESEEIANTFNPDLSKSENDYESAKNFLDFLSTEKPIIFIIREGQYLTEDTIKFINFLSPTIYQKPILIIVSVNDPSKIKGLIHSVQIKVSSLTFEETKKYIKNLLNIEPNESFIKNILLRSAGNPYFIKEILIDLIEKKLLLKENQINFDVDFENYTLPEHLVHSIYNRMSHLDSTTYRYLQKLSIVHTPITKDLITKLFKISDKELFNFLQDGLNNEIIYEKESFYEFSFQEAKQRLLRESSTQERVEVSKSLINYYNQENFSDIEVSKGIIKNAELCKNYEAIRKFRMMLVSLYSTNHDQVNAFKEISKIIELDLSGLIEVQEFDIRTDFLLFIEKADLTGLVHEALDLLKQHDKKNDLFEWHYAFSALYFRTEKFDLAEQHLEEALPLAYTGRQQIRLYLDLAIILTVLRKHDAAKYIFEKLSLYSLGAEFEVIYFDRYGSYLSSLNKDEEAINWYEDSIVKLQQSHSQINTARLGSLYNNLGILYCKYKMFPEAQKLFFNCKKEWERINYDRLLGTIYNNIGDMSLRQGDTNNALEYFKKAEQISRKVNNKRSLALAFINYGETNIKLGKFIEAENYLFEAKKILNDINNPSLSVAIDNNFALAKNKVINFYQFYKFLEAEFPEILQGKIKEITPLTKSYFFYLYEIGDREKIESILYSDLNFSITQDEDFYYQLLAMLSTLKGDFVTAIDNYKLALDYAQKTTSYYSLSIIYLNLAICYCLNNEADKAMEYLENSELLIKVNNYHYWNIVKDITRIKIYFLKSDIPLRTLLRKAFYLLPIVKNSHYFLQEIELYRIIIQIYERLNAKKLAQSFYKTYSEKVRDAIRYLPETDQKKFLSTKKITIKNINDINFFFIVKRATVKPSEWNNEILPLLRLEDTERIKFFLDQKINQYFAPDSYAVITLNSNSYSLQSISTQNYSIYLQNKFSISVLNIKEVIFNINKAIEDNRTITIKVNQKNTVISPIMLKHSKIGFWILQDNGEMPFTQHEIKLIHSFSFHLSTMLIRLSEFDEVNQKISLMQRLMNITSNMMQTYDLEKLEYELIQNIIEITKATRGFLIKKDKLGNYYFSVALDNDNHLLNNASNFSKTTVSEVQSSRHPIFIENSLEDINLKNIFYTLDNQANSLYCAPIIVENEIYALLYLDNLGETHSNLKINEEMMTMFLLQVSLALNNAKTYQSLMAKNWELHTLDTMKNDFISIVSHELNTPLITLQGYMQKLKKNVNPIDIETKEILSKVDKSTKKLIGTIQDIMTLNRYNTSTKITKEEVNIFTILNSVYQEIILMAANRKMKINLEVEDDIPDIELEWQSFHVLILNLMLNAIRFTTDYGSIILGARKAIFPHEKINDKDSIVLYVQDNGIGIPENEQENVFKAFYELGDIYSHRSGFLEFRSGGLGIGLAIAKRITELHSGKIWLKSKEKEGTTVFVSLPIIQFD